MSSRRQLVPWSYPKDVNSGTQRGSYFTVGGVSSFAAPPPTHTHSQSRCSSQVVSNDRNDSHRKPLETDWKGDESSLAEAFHGSPAMAPEVEPGVL